MCAIFHQLSCAVTNSGIGSWTILSVVFALRWLFYNGTIFKWLNCNNGSYYFWLSIISQNKICSVTFVCLAAILWVTLLLIIIVYGFLLLYFYEQVRSYPRRAFNVCDSSLTLSERGLTNKQEALFLELI